MLKINLSYPWVHLKIFEMNYIVVDFLTVTCNKINIQIHNIISLTSSMLERIKVPDTLFECVMSFFKKDKI